MRDTPAKLVTSKFIKDLEDLHTVDYTDLHIRHDMPTRVGLSALD